MEKDFNSYSQFPDYNTQNYNFDMNEIYKDPIFSPMMQYEQACSYYRYLCMQMDYKIKCKEYEKMCHTTNDKREDSRNRT